MDEPVNLDAYDRLITTIYDCGRGETPLGTMLHAVRASTSADAAGLSLYDEADEVITHTLIASSRQPSEPVLDQVRHLNHDASARLFIRPRFASARRFTDIVPEARLRHSRWFRQQVELGRMGHGIVADTQADGIRIRLFVTRADSAGNFGFDQVALIDRLSRHLGRAFAGALRRLAPASAPDGIGVVTYHANRVAAAMSGRLPGMGATDVERFGLSRAEARVLAVMARGPTREVAAMHLGISASTLKSHMRRIYAKTGARRIPELIHLLQGGGAGRDEG